LIIILTKCGLVNLKINKMRKITKIELIVMIVLSIFLINSCTKNTLRTTETILAEDKAYTKFYFLSPATPAVMLKINDIKINGSNTSGSLGVFPPTINFPDYAATSPGGNLKMALPIVGTGNDSIVIFTGILPTTAKKYYSVTLADTGIDRTMFTIEDNQGDLTDSGFYKIRLINAMAKSPNLSLIRVDSNSAAVVVRDTLFRDIAFKSASDYIKVPYTSKVIAAPNPSIYSFLRYRLVVTSTGASIGNLITPAQTTSINQRYVTIYAYGFANGTGIYAPTLSPIVYNK
jgi:hypothetical protein